MTTGATGTSNSCPRGAAAQGSLHLDITTIDNALTQPWSVAEFFRETTL
jgi:hypothetical protein